MLPSLPLLGARLWPRPAFGWKPPSLSLGPGRRSTRHQGRLQPLSLLHPLPLRRGHPRPCTPFILLPRIPNVQKTIPQSHLGPREAFVHVMLFYTQVTRIPYMSAAYRPTDPGLPQRTRTPRPSASSTALLYLHPLRPRLRPRPLPPSGPCPLAFVRKPFAPMRIASGVNMNIKSAGRIG